MLLPLISAISTGRCLSPSKFSAIRKASAHIVNEELTPSGAGTMELYRQVFLCLNKPATASDLGSKPFSFDFSKSTRKLYNHHPLDFLLNPRSGIGLAAMIIM
jgi:hypothetical protein